MQIRKNPFMHALIFGTCRKAAATVVYLICAGREWSCCVGAERAKKRISFSIQSRACADRHSWFKAHIERARCAQSERERKKTQFRSGARNYFAARFVLRRRGTFLGGNYLSEREREPDPQRRRRRHRFERERAHPPGPLAHAQESSARAAKLTPSRRFELLRSVCAFGERTPAEIKREAAKNLTNEQNQPR